MKESIMRSTYAYLFFALAGGTFSLPNQGSAQHDEMTFEMSCIGNAVEGCYVVAEGMISPRTPDFFEKFISSGTEAGYIALSSPGGNLGAGVRLGRLIRKSGLNTTIGDGAPVVNGEGKLGPADCLSACAYAYLGGNERTLREGSRLGFHQFYLAGDGVISGSDAQVISGELISYIVEMGVDARIFTNASKTAADKFYFVTDADAVDLGVSTPYGYGDFFLEPYQNGVVAATRRLDEPSAYDHTYQVTAYCRAGVPYLLFAAQFAPGRPEEFSIVMDYVSYFIGENRVSTRSGSDIGFLEVELDGELARRLALANSVSTSFNYARAEGGHIGASLKLTEMDRLMINAAFNFCI